MSTEYSSSVIRSLVDKLGHSLAEVREGALKNLKFKVDHGLLHPSDVIQRKDLLEKLLDWFNKPHCTMEGEVLSVILMLSEHDSAVSLLNGLGAVEFLSQLRSVLDEKYHGCIDSILQNLLHLPNSLQTSSRPTTSPASQQGIELGNETLSASHVSDELSFSLAVPEDRLSRASKCPSSHDVSPASSNPVHPPKNRLSSAQFGTHTEGGARRTGLCFPLVSLTQNDDEILNSTFSRLHSTDQILLIKTCNFLVDVLFKDFPVEVFLQRPVLCQTLFHLLSHALAAGNEAVCVAVLKSLTCLTQQVCTRFVLLSNPACYSNIETAYAESTSPVDRCLPSVGVSDAKVNGFTRTGETTVEEFTIQIVKTVSPLMKHSGLVLAGLKLLQADVVLLNLWCPHHGNQTVNQVVDENLIIETLQELGDMLTHMLFRASSEDSKKGQFAILFHLIACLSFVAILILELTVVPVNSMNLVPLPLRECVAPLAMDEFVSLVYPSVRQRLIPYLSVIQPKQSEMLRQCLEVCESFSSTWKILEKPVDKEGKNKTVRSELFEQLGWAETAMPGLAFHRRLDVTEQILDICVVLYERTETDKEKERAVKLLLKLLAFPDHHVKMAAYTQCLSILRKKVGDDFPLKSGSWGKKCVVMQQQVLVEICCFGLNDLCVEVNVVARDFVVHLLSHTDKLDCLPHLLLPVLPYIEAQIGKHKELDHVVMRQLNPIPTGSLTAPTVFNKLERVQGLCRLLFSVDPCIRGWALSAICQLLYETEPHDVTGSSNGSERDCLVSSRCQTPWQSSNTRLLGKFTEDGVLKVYSILTNTDIAMELRKSAAEQLAVILEDPRLHECVLKAGIVNMLVDLSQTLVQKCEVASSKEIGIALLPLTWRILHLLALHNDEVCTEISCNLTMYSVLIKGSLTCYRQPELEVHVHASRLLQIMLFSEISKDFWKSKGSEIDHGELKRLVIPSSLKKRFHVLSEEVDSFSVNTIPVLRADERAMHMLKIVYNVSKHGSAETLLASVNEGHEEEDKELMLLDSDITHLQNTLPSSLVRLSLDGLKSATSHEEAEEVIRVLSVLLHTVWLGWTVRVFKNPPETPSHSGRESVDELVKCGINNWKDAFDRFLHVPPTTSDDHHLLSSVFSCLSLLVACLPHDQCKDWLDWLLPYAAAKELSETSTKAYATSSETSSSYNMPAVADQTIVMLSGSEFTERTLQQCHCSFLLAVIKRAREIECIPLVAPFQAKVIRWLIALLDKCDDSNYSHMPVVERVVDCLVHVTAIPNWSCSCSDGEKLSFCCEVGACLSKVVQVFQCGREGAPSSFIGKGIIRRAALCLSHLASEMERAKTSDDWTADFLELCAPDQQTPMNTQLAWLVILLHDHELEVRFAAYAIFSLLCGYPAGVTSLFTTGSDVLCEQWMCNTALSCVTNSKEAAVVRQQAASLLANLSRNVTSSDILGSMLCQQTIQCLAKETAMFNATQYFSRSCGYLVNSGAELHSSTKKLDSNLQLSPITDSVAESDLSPCMLSTTSTSWPSFLVQSDCQTSPGLLAALCHWLRNLVAAAPQQTTVRLLDEGMVHSLIQQIAHFPVLTVNLVKDDSDIARTSQLLSVIADLFDMLSEIFSLMQSIITHHAHSCPPLLHSDVVSAACQLWHINPKMSASRDDGAYQRMIEALSGYLRVTIHFHDCHASTGLPPLSQTLHYRLSNVTCCLPVQQLALLADFLVHVQQEKQDAFCGDNMDWINGAAVMKSLIIFSDSLDKDKGCAKLAVVSAIKALLGVSHAAKEVALDSGFLETTVNELQDMEAGLRLVSQKPRLSQMTRKKQEEAFLQPAALLVNLLTNLLSSSQTAKVAAVEEGLVKVANFYWTYCLLYHVVMRSILKLLVTFTAGCTRACIALSHSSTQYGDRSLLHGVIKLASRLSSQPQAGSKLVGQQEHVEQMQLAFSLLANVVLCQECLSSLWKSNVVSLFPTSFGGSGKGGKMDEKRAFIWLRLLGNLTFSQEGQKMLLKAPEGVSTVLSFAASKSNAVCALAILVIRNICFSSYGRSVVLHDENCVGLLAKLACEDDQKIAELSFSALNALLQSGHKVRTILKQLNILDKTERYQPRPIRW